MKMIAIYTLAALWTMSNYLVATKATATIAMSNQCTCTLAFDNIKCWGLGTYGTLGTGNANDLKAPPTDPIDLGTEFVPKSLICGGNHCCSISTNNATKCWGHNTLAQCGQGDVDNKGDEADEMGDYLKEIDWGSDFVIKQIAPCGGHTCGLSTDKRVKCFGDAQYGNLGYGDTTTLGDDEGELGDSLPYVDLGSDFTPNQLNCGNGFTCVLSDFGTVKCWGRNRYGQLGKGDTSNRGDGPGEMGDNLMIIDLGTDFNASMIHCGLDHVCALSTSIEPEVKCWGDNQYAQLGLGDTENRGDDTGEMGDYLPTVNVGDLVPEYVYTARYSGFVVSSDGRMRMWGRNRYGQLGIGSTSSIGDGSGEMGDALSDMELGTGFTVAGTTSDVSMYHMCALVENGTEFLGLKCWGWNSVGQLGLSDTDNRGDGANEMGDNLPLVPIALWTQSPTKSPTKNPTKSPTMSPTKSPTKRPSDSPTISPTTHTPTSSPSMEPTHEPTISPSEDPTAPPSTCITMNLEVNHFAAFTDDDLAGDTEKQSDIANVTEMAIGQNAKNFYNKSEFDSFIVSHVSVTGNYVQESLSIVQRLCAFSRHDLSALISIVENKNDYIDTAITNDWITLYLNGKSAESFTVILSISAGFVMVSITYILLISETTHSEMLKPEKLHLEGHDDLKSDCYFVLHRLRDSTLETSSDGLTPSPEPSIANASTEQSSFPVMIVCVSGGAFVLCILCFYIVQYISHKKLERRMADVIGDELKMRNGLIVCVPIGHYQKKPDGAEVRGIIKNLPVERDLEHMKKLAEYLNYTFLTIEDKLSWTEVEVMDFMRYQVGAEFFGENNEPKYDGLIVAFSGHGVKDHILTSDLKKIERTAIHRCVSNQFPKIRDFPRVFLFDACDGTGDRKNTVVVPPTSPMIELKQRIPSQSLVDDDQKEYGIEMSSRKEVAKATELNDVQNVNVWTKSSKNPDYGLPVVHASNKGFVAKMKGGSVGSYLTYFFTKAVMQYHKIKGLASMLEEINETLHFHGKQQIRTEFFSKTRNLRFEINVFE